MNTKLVFACPSYGPIDPMAVRSQRVAIMHAASNGITWVGDSSPDRMKFDASRNVSVKSALDGSPEAEAIFWCDSDVILPPHTITSLVMQDKDFITGIYFQRLPPHYPLIARFNSQGGQDRTGSFNWFTGWPEDTIAPIDGCGFGCVLTSTRMLRSMGAGPWFTFEKYSEDFDFCLRAEKAGFQLYVHTGVLCGHLADPVPVGAADFLKIRDSVSSKEEVA